MDAIRRESTTALNMEESNADIRHKNIFHCESGALAKSGKIWILFLFIFKNEKMYCYQDLT